MIVPVLIDTSDLQDEFSLSQKDIENMIDLTIKNLTLEYYRLWQNQVSKNLKSTRNRYLNSLVYINEGFMKGAVILRDDDPLAMMIEEGASEFDQKEYFAKSEKRKKKKDGGWYLTIPFRHATPQALGESEVFAGVLPPEIYEKVKSADTYIPIGAGLRSEGLKLEEIPEQFRQKTVREAIPESKLLQARQEYISKSGKYEGLIKIKDTTTSQTSGYMTFRRVSDQSDHASWIHTGIDKRNFAEQALSELEIDKIVDVQIDNFLAKYLK